jgi:ABC-type antimicrobial peptide transport system permease subunit
VVQRTREIGIRMALGASRATVALDVVRRCVVSVASGAVVGLLVFWVVRRVLST